MSRLTRDGTAEPVSRDQILRRERGQGKLNFSCLADHEQDWQPYPVDPYSCYMCMCRGEVHRYTVCMYVRNNVIKHGSNNILLQMAVKTSPGRSTPVAQLAPRNLLTRWDVSSIPANGIFLTKN